MQLCSTYVFQGVGKGITSMFQTIMRETGFTIIFAVLLSIVFDFGVWGGMDGYSLRRNSFKQYHIIMAELYVKN